MRQSLFLLLAILFLQSGNAFENPFKHSGGSVILVKETRQGEVLVVAFNKTEQAYIFSKLNEKGQMIRSVSLGKLDSLKRIDQIYEFEDGYGVTYGIGKDKRYFSQVFRTFDDQLNSIMVTPVTISDSMALVHDIWYEINENLTWVGMIHPNNQGATLNCIQFTGDGTITRAVSVIDTFLYSHHSFLKVFTHTDSSITCFTSKNNRVHYYKVRGLGQTIIHDSIKDLYENNDSLGVHTFFRDMKMTSEDVFVGLTGYDNGAGKYGIKLWELEQQKIVRTKILFHADTIPSYHAGAGYNNSMSFFQGQLFVKETYSSPTFAAREKIYRIDTSFTQVTDWTIFENINIGSLSTMSAGKGGACFIGGSEYDSLGNNFIYLAKIDSTGTVTYVSKLIAESKNIVLYPNPGKDRLLGIPADSEFVLFDMSGKKMQISSSTNGIDVSAVQTGMYFYQIYDEQGGLVSSGKWVKE